MDWGDNPGFVGYITSDGQRLTFNYALAPAPVPLPAALWLMLTGLASMGIAGRRRLSPERE